MAQPSAYFDRLNLDLLEAIPAGAGRVLEIGCGAGALGRAFRAQNPQAVHTGIERDAEAAREAATRLDRVVVGDVEDERVLAGLEGELFDVLVFGDVLEHLADPWRVLGGLRRLAAPGGLAVACLPNVQHWSVLAGLLEGRWDYAGDGLLDRAHLRFFTLKSALELFHGAGWTVETVAGRIFERERAEGFIAALAPAVATLGLDSANFQAGALPLQYIIKARNAG